MPSDMQPIPAADMGGLEAALSALSTRGQRPNVLRTELLYRALPPLSQDRLSQHFAEFAPGLALKPEPIRRDTDTAALCLRYSGPACDVMVSLHDTPLGADRFAGALEGAYAAKTAGVLSELISRHAAHVVVEIRPHTPFKSSGRDENARFADAIALSHTVTSALARLVPPQAVYWGQSHQLLSGPHYAEFYGISMPWALFLHPVPVPNPVTRQLDFDGAAMFLGRPLSIRGAVTPAHDMVRLGLGFVQHCFESGHVLADGHSFGRSQDEKILVSHDNGGIVLICPGARADTAGEPAPSAAPTASAQSLLAALALPPAAQVIARAKNIRARRKRLITATVLGAAIALLNTFGAAQSGDHSVSALKQADQAEQHSGH